jgi:hypothetical protein
MKKNLLFIILFSTLIYAQEPLESFNINSSHVSMDNLSFDTGDIFMELKSNETTMQLETTNIQVYPNPFTDKINLSFDKPIENIEIYSMEGKLIYKEQLPKNTIDLKHLNTGLYLLIINKETNFKILKL